MKELNHLNKVEKLINTRLIYLIALTLIESLIFFGLYKTYNHSIFLAVSVLLYGFASGLFIKRWFDVRLGGIVTYALLLYYSLGNILVLAHFLFIVAIALIIYYILARKGIIGEFLFYTSAIIIFPLTIVSYSWFTQYFSSISIVSGLHHAGNLIYILLPTIYSYNLTKQDSKSFVKDLILLIVALAFSFVLWRLAI